MEKEALKIPGLYKIHFFKSEDSRGDFVKTFHKENFGKIGIDLEIRENFYSTSHKDVIRGMHFQTPPYQHNKLVFALQGDIVDVVLDLRKHSPTFGSYEAIQLSDKSATGLYIPEGLAHGFISKSESSILYYLTSREYAPKHDTGIRFDSFGYDWEIENPIVSQRDLDFESFKDFQSPF